MSETPHFRRFTADPSLGKLARLLRMLGQDVEAAPPEPRADVIRAAQDRILLTRDSSLAREVPGALLVENAYPFHQARQVLRAFGLGAAVTRCPEDNGVLEALEAPSEVDVPEGAAAAPAEGGTVYRCTRCARLHGSGSDIEAMRATILELADAPRPPDDHAEGLDDGGRLEGLEPLLDMHQALDALFWTHRVALLRGDFTKARATLRRFTMNMSRHIRLEEELVLPIYRGSPPPDGFERGGAPDIFQRDHEKILRAGSDFEQRAEAILAQEDRERRELQCLELLDRQRKYLDLLAHHDHRERLHLYPHLARLLSPEKQTALVQRFGGLISSTGAEEAGSFER